jgi:acetate kinase
VTTILCLNAGSSSVKAAVFDGDLTEQRRIAQTGAVASKCILTDLASHTPDVIVHRIVHGADAFDRPCVVDAHMMQTLNKLVPLAPLHLPPALDLIHTSSDHFPTATQVACFDTAFHHHMPDIARRYPLPQIPLTQQVRRYGFHGLSCENVVATLTTAETRRLIVAHLGAGCSVTAVKDGKSINTSMGFTPAGGVFMATRSGDLDPGLLLYLLKNGLTVDELDHLVNVESGLTAIAGTGDMRTLLERTDDDANLAVDMFCSHVAQRIAAYAVSLGELETLAFTGGIGERASGIRDRIVEHLHLLQPFETRTVPTNEELVMARHALRFLPQQHR